MENYCDVSLNPFPDLHIRRATVEHTRTAILLHERGSSGPEFAEHIFSLKLDDSGEDLLSLLPEWRWVFPSARRLWTPGLKSQIPSWFESNMLLDATTRKHLADGGLRESVQYLVDLIHLELRLLGDVAENLILLGHGQGAAVGLWALLCRRPEPSVHPIRGFVGLNCWLPFTKEVHVFLNSRSTPVAGGVVNAWEYSENYQFVRKLMNSTKEFIASYESEPIACPLLSTPIFIGHYTDNPHVSMMQGAEAHDVLDGLGFKRVYWDEVIETDGNNMHWLSDQGQLARIVAFFEQKGVFAAELYQGSMLD